MAQPGVAREPSMEEILASIRRIIESNEPESMQAAGGGLPAYDLADDEDEHPAEEAEEIHLTIEDELPDFSAVAPPRPERTANPAVQAAVRPPLPQQPARETAAPSPVAAAQPVMPENQQRRDIEQRSMSLADVAARVRAASERSPSDMLRGLATSEAAVPSRPVELRPAAVMRSPEPAPVMPSPASAPRAAADSEPRLQASVRPDTATPSSVQAAPRSAEAELASLAANDRATQAEPRPAPDSAQPVRRIEPVQTEQALTVAEEPKSLVSAETGLQVARSFDELAEMVQSTAKRSLDEVAEELLRPMLQEWLDDNLPTLVERLVREEIERVARGPRR